MPTLTPIDLQVLFLLREQSPLRARDIAVKLFAWQKRGDVFRRIPGLVRGGFIGRSVVEGIGVYEVTEDGLLIVEGLLDGT